MIEPLSILRCRDPHNWSKGPLGAKGSLQLTESQFYKFKELVSAKIYMSLKVNSPRSFQKDLSSQHFDFDFVKPRGEKPAKLTPSDLRNHEITNLSCSKLQWPWKTNNLFTPSRRRCQEMWSSSYVAVCTTENSGAICLKKTSCICSTVSLLYRKR